MLLNHQARALSTALWLPCLAWLRPGDRSTIGVRRKLMRQAKPRRGDPLRIIGYARCSTEDQTLGPVAQRHALQAWVHARGAELVAVHEDLGLSGGAGIEKRPGLLAALDALREHGAGILLVAKRDRLARDPIVAAMVERLAERAGGAVVSAAGEGNGDAPADVLMRRMIDAFAEHERLIIRARTQAALAVKRSRGERIGDVPYGFKLAADRVHLVEVTEEQAVIRETRRLRAEGLTLRAVCARLSEAGRAPRIGAWHPEKVRRLLNRSEPVTSAA